MANAPAVAFPQSAVAFVDILGFSAMVQRDANSANPQFLPMIKKIIDSAVAAAVKEPVALRNFSDSIVLSCPYSLTGLVSLLRMVKHMQILGLESGVLFRGGVSYGRHYADDNVIYSAGLVAAYRIESQRARVPRVILDAELMQLVERATDEDGGVKQQFERVLAVDRDENVFVDYLAGLSKDELITLAGRIKEIAEAPETRDPGIFEKVHWLCDYFNGHYQACLGEPYTFGLPRQKSYRWPIAEAAKETSGAADFAGGESKPSEAPAGSAESVTQND